MDAPPPPKARRPPSLRWTWLFHLGSAILGIMVLWVLILMILEAGFPRRLKNNAIVAGMGLFQIGMLQFSRFRIRRKVAEKAPGMCPVCEYALDMTRATAGETPILCPECGYRDTAQGVKAFWTRHLGEPLP